MHLNNRIFDRIAFWRDPANVPEELRSYDRGKLYRFTQPAFYVTRLAGVDVVTKSMTAYAKKDWSILEIGCGAGRNLGQLAQAGFTNLRGVEINPRAVEMAHTSPLLADVPILCSPIEDVIRLVEPADVILSVGVLMHLPHELDWVLDEIAEKARRLLFLFEFEGDGDEYFYKWARDYRAEFEARGWRQIEEESGANYPPIPASSVKRVFVRA